MLERLTDSFRTRRRRRGPVALSIAAHIGALGAFLGAAAWQVDKLEPSETPIFVATAFASSFPVEGDPPPARATERGTGSGRVVDTPSERPPAPKTGGGGDVDPTGPSLFEGCPPGSACVLDNLNRLAEPVCGNRVVEIGEECDDGGTAGGDGCSGGCRAEPPAMVGARLIEGYRIAGDPQIPPPASVRAQMARNGQRQAVGRIQMCLGADGAVRSLRVLRPTGHPAYDSLLTDRMREWRYRPYRTAGGEPVPVCTVVTFIYRVQ
jgi:TonB family protein